MAETLDYLIPRTQVMRTNDGRTLIKNRRFFGFKTAQLPDRTLPSQE